MAATILIQFLMIFTILFFYSSPSLLASNNPTYNVQNYGAKSNGKSDCTKAFLSAWGAACAAQSPATIYVPSGRYLVRNIVFGGDSCKNKAITIRIDGTLVAPSDYNAIAKGGKWLLFQRVTGVSIYGGTLDAQGSKLYACKDSSKSCPEGSTTLGLYGSRDMTINELSSVNSQKFHIIVDGSTNVNLLNMKISAPEDSPNTDGIHVEHSSGVSITNALIGTGDDCVSIGPGASNLMIQNLTCGPGHGVSIGSLGWKINEEGVQNVTVKTATFTKTQNGVRVKTWARASRGFVKGVIFQHILMNDVKNPIIIDQNYCPNHGNCPKQGSGVKISDVTYEDIHGTSATKVAIKFDCSKTQPCTGLHAEQVKLTYQNKPATTTCANAIGTLEVDGDEESKLPSICSSNSVYYDDFRFMEP